MRRLRSIPLIAARCLLTVACAAVGGAWGASHRWILERHWIDLTTFPEPRGWVMMIDGRVYWGRKNGPAWGGFTPDATVQYHAWERKTFISTPTPDGDFSILPEVIAITAATLLVWIVPPLLRRHRKRRGLCDCGYDLKGLPRETPCPECGSLRKGVRLASSASAAEL